MKIPRKNIIYQNLLMISHLMDVGSIGSLQNEFNPYGTKKEEKSRERGGGRRQEGKTLNNRESRKAFQRHALFVSTGESV